MLGKLAEFLTVTLNLPVFCPLSFALMVGKAGILRIKGF
jgi:hypothetical protein